MLILNICVDQVHGVSYHTTVRWQVPLDTPSSSPAGLRDGRRLASIATRYLSAYFLFTSNNISLTSKLTIQREQVKTVQDALQYISHPQPVQISIPTRPGQVIEASQQTLIESLPPILVLHMKRFQYDTSVGDVVKISKQVAYRPDLEIPAGASLVFLCLVVD